MAASLREVVYQKDFLKTRYCVLAGDIGGTNSNFGIFEMRGMVPTLLISLHAPSKEITDFGILTKQVLEHVQQNYGIEIRKACFGAAGISTAERDYIKPTNLAVALEARAIKQTSGLESLVLINDFEAVGLGIDSINPQDVVCINHGIPKKRGQKACLGAGTGMGKAALLWNRHFHRYLPFASEGGHADCAAQTKQEYELFKFITAERNHGCPVSWEDVLSGNGIKRIYRFLATEKTYPETAISKEIEKTGFKPDLISYYAEQDSRCADTFTLYTTFYARCAKDFVLDTLALNGVYIAGGIAARNLKLFSQEHFLEEFMRCGAQSKTLHDVPVYVVADYNVSLYGAVVFLQLREQGVL